MLRVAQQLFGVFQELTEQPVVGRESAWIDRFVQRYLARHGLSSAMVAYRGYPAHSSVSINDVAIHGIPGERPVARGDIFTLDVAARGGGYVADAAWTYSTAGSSRKDRELVRRGWETFLTILRRIGPGRGVSEIGDDAVRCAETAGLTIIPEFVGHGIGRDLHEEPIIPFVMNPGGRRDGEVVLRPGMIVNIEPVFTSGTPSVTAADDGWGYRTVDHSKTVHFELSLLITDDGAKVLQFGGISPNALPETPPFGGIPD